MCESVKIRESRWVHITDPDGFRCREAPLRAPHAGVLVNVPAHWPQSADLEEWYFVPSEESAVDLLRWAFAERRHVFATARNSSENLVVKIWIRRHHQVCTTLIPVEAGEPLPRGRRRRKPKRYRLRATVRPIAEFLHCGPGMTCDRCHLNFMKIHS